MTNRGMTDGDASATGGGGRRPAAGAARKAPAAKTAQPTQTTQAAKAAETPQATKAAKAARTTKAVKTAKAAPSSPAAKPAKAAKATASRTTKTTQSAKSPTPPPLAEGPRIDGLNGSALVTRRGSMLVEAAGGMADAAAGAPCTPLTRFPVSSVGKQFTAAAVMLLVESRLITLEDRLERLLPNCPEHWREITVHHLLSHTSGLGHWSSIPGFDVMHPLPAEEVLHLSARLPLLDPPGTLWRYSGTGYLLAAGIVEHIAGQDYSDFLTERIFAPLGMAQTTAGRFLGSADSGVKSVARDGHLRGKPTTIVPELAGYPGTGDVWSTVGDLARYALAVNSGALLSERSRLLVHYPHTAVSAELNAPERVLRFESYGYGYYLGTVGGHQAICHTGDNPGFHSFHAWLPDLDVCIAVLTNDEASDMGHIVRQLLPA